MMTHAICQEKECGKEFDYELKVGYPRKYCPDCSAKRKAEWDTKQINTPVTSNDMQETIKTERPGEVPKPKIKEPTGEYQSLVYNKTISANSYEVGKAGERFKLYFETVEELQDKIKELKTAGLMTEEVNFEEEAKKAFALS